MSPWLYIPWCLVLAIVTIGGGAQDVREGKPVRAALAVASGAVCIAAVLAFAGVQWVGAPHPSLAPLCAASAGWLLFEAISDYRSVEADPELSAEENDWLRFGAALLVILLFAPALVLGMKVGLTAWL